MAIETKYNVLPTDLEEAFEEFKKIYSQRKQAALKKAGVSDPFMAILNSFIDHLIRFGETYPTTLPGSGLSEILEYSEKPIFVGGVHKSGTTLLRNLLDGHSGLAVLPLDGPGTPFLTNCLNLAEDKCHHKILRQILKRLIIPNIEGWYDTGNWLLSNGQVIIEPYMTFACNYYSWIARFGRGVKGILQTLAIAYRESSHYKNLSKTTSWVHKSTLHVDAAKELSLYFPKAKFLHITRHPCGIYASQKTKAPLIKQRDCNPNYELDCLQRGFGYGLRNYKALGPDRYYILKYEELVKNVKACMKQTISFLNYDYEESLIQPTIVGTSVKSNTAYRENKNEAGVVSNTSVDIWNQKLNRHEANVLIFQLQCELPFYGYLEKKISTKDFLWSLLHVESKYLGEKGIKLFNLKSIVWMMLNAFFKRNI